jgi:uncharacterized damage-inducible protein DinB
VFRLAPGGAGRHDSAARIPPRAGVNVKEARGIGDRVKETQRIGDQLRRAYEGGAWHGDALAELLDGVTAAAASARPLAGAHSIWEIVLHVAAWLETARARVETGRPVDPAAEEDWPPVADAGEAAWLAARERLARSHRALLGTVAALDDARLDERIAGGPQSVYFLLHGVIQHSLYHAGQIALLKRA